MKYLSFFALVLICACSCSTQQEEKDPSGFSYTQYFADIQKADNCLNEGEAFQVLGERMDISIKAPLDNIISTVTLKKLYYKAIDKQATDPPPASGRCMNTNVAVKERVLQRFAKLNNEDSISALIDIYSDKNISFSRSEAKNFTRLLTEMGPSILPKLTPVKDQRPTIGPVVIQNLKNR